MSANLQRHYKLCPSLYLVIVIVFASLLSLLVLFVLPFNTALFLMMSCAVILASVTVLLKDALLRLPDACVAFRIESDGGVSLVLRDGRPLKGRLLASSVVLPYLVLIHVRLERGGYRRLVLLIDSMEADSFRHLRCLLRWDAKQQESLSSV